MRKTKMKTILSKILMLGILAAALASPALTLEDLRNMPKLTPKKFARQFAEFRYEFHGEVQAPEDFLAREAGDCDDFAILGALVLGEKGFHPRLISVRMRNISHVVCYFPETRSYIDYNDRAYLFTATTSSDGTLGDIAKKVSKTFGASWSSVTEFSYADGEKLLVARLENPRFLVAAR